MRVLIIGGGLTGLALANGLRHFGVDPVVVEQAPIITEAGWAIGLSPRHLAALDRIGVTGWKSWPGQGAGAGFEDAAMLAELLTTPGMAVPTALASFERIRKPEAQSLQKLSYDTSRLMTTTSAPSVIYANRGNMPGGV